MKNETTKKLGLTKKSAKVKVAYLKIPSSRLNTSSTSSFEGSINTISGHAAATSAGLFATSAPNFWKHPGKRLVPTQKQINGEEGTNACHDNKSTKKLKTNYDEAQTATLIISRAKTSTKHTENLHSEAQTKETIQNSPKFEKAILLYNAFSQINMHFPKLSRFCNSKFHFMLYTNGFSEF